MKSIQIRTEPEDEFEIEFWLWARDWWLRKIASAPDTVRRERRIISYLCRTTGKQRDTLRRMFQVMKLYPYRQTVIEYIKESDEKIQIRSKS